MSLTPEAIVITLAPTRESSLVVQDGSAGNADLITLVLEPIFRGPPGVPGPSGSVPFEVDQVAVSGVNTISVPVAFDTTATRLYINGLRQSPSSYSISGQVVTLPTTLNCIAGDVLSFEYLPT